MKWGLLFLLLVSLLLFAISNGLLTSVIKALIGSATHGQNDKSRISTLHSSSKSRYPPNKNSAKLVAEVFKKHNATFKEVIDAASDHEKTLVLTILDSNFIPFTLNFQQTSLQYLQPHYLLLVCLDHVTRTKLQQNGLDCYVFKRSGNVTMLPSGGDFGSADYYLKTNLKTHIILQTLLLGYTTLIVDQDVTLFQNPFEYFSCINCDIHVQRDRVQINSGFVYIKPTKASTRLYSSAWDLYARYNQSHDQTYLNMAVRVMEIANQTLRIENLPPSKFLCGVYYFENGNRMFGDKPCKDCVMVHNNYIGSLAAKEYRMKENRMWFLDEDEYYSSQKAKYLLYDNPAYFGDSTLKTEMKSLLWALKIGNLTGRIVILPKFHCCECSRKKCSGELYRCPLLSVLRVKSFDQVYKGKYREHSFFHHPKVPKKYVDAVQLAKVLRIKSDIYDSIALQPYNKSITEFLPLHKDEGASPEEILKFLQPYADDPIIRFHSLYKVYRPTSVLEQRVIEKTLNSTFKCAEYEQWDVKDQLHNKF